jgi:uncharacterized protein YciI
MSAYMYTITAVRKDMLKTGLNEQKRMAFQAHTLYLEDLAKKGVLIIAGRTLLPEESMGIGIFYADSDEEARKIVADDPFVSHGVVKPRLVPFGLAAGTALERKKKARSSRFCVGAGFSPHSAG